MSRCQSSLLDGFTDDWDAALLSEGTLRPKRAASAMNLREVMKNLTKSPAGSVTKEELENQFSRSMKLLGLERSASASSKTIQKPKLRNVSPRTITRLDKPTVSYEDIRNAVADGVDRKVLSQAAYERWYFRKLEEERSKNIKNFLDLDKRSKLFEHGLSFNEWLEKKDKERKLKKATPEIKPTDKKTRRHLPVSSQATKEAAEKAYQDWLEKKNADEARKKQKLKEELAAKNATKTREDAEKAFEEWKRSCDEKLKKMELRKRNRERKLREKEQDEKERHMQDCEKAFNAWLSGKNQLILEQQEKNRRKSTKKSIQEQKRLEEKKYEAKQAFEDWLEKKLEEEASKIPPPDPKVTKSIQTEDASARPSSTIRKTRSPGPNFPRNLMVPWSDFSTTNNLSAKTSRPPSTPTVKKPKVKFADSFDSETSDPNDKLSRPSRSESHDRYKDFTKIRQLSDNKSIMMLYHKKDPNCALYYARDLI